MNTLPVLILKYRLPCETYTIEKIGTSTACWVNRSSMFILLGILISFCALTCDVFATMKYKHGKSGTPFLKVASVVVPTMLLILAYGFDSVENADYFDPDIENGTLNVARHSFSCSMRFETLAIEWGLLWIHFIWSSVGIVLFTLGSWWEIRSATKQQSALRDSNRTSSENSVVSPDDISINANSSDLLSDLTVSSIANINAGTTNKSIADTRRKLVWVAVLLCACLCFAMALMIYMVPPLKQWTESADALLECSLLEMSGRSPDASAISGVAGFLPGQAICSQASILSSEGQCGSDCFWRPDIDINDLVCALPGNTIESMVSQLTTRSCDCSCQEMLREVCETDLVANDVAIMTLSFAAQSLVVAIVGVYMGFRKGTLNLWMSLFSTATRDKSEVSSEAGRESSGVTGEDAGGDDTFSDLAMTSAEDSQPTGLI